eukprot:jgi/Chlat1/8062/Chrsp73S07533
MAVAEALWRSDTVQRLANACLKHPFVQVWGGKSEEWGVDLSLFSTPAPSTLAYTRFLYEAASGASVHRFIAKADQHPNNSHNNTIDAVINKNNPLGDGVAQALAALTPCMRLYVFLGKAIGEQQPPTVQHAYSKWIETYSAPEFEAQAVLLERLLDDVASAEGVLSAALQPVYERAMRLEHNFFEANWLNAHT